VTYLYAAKIGIDGEDVASSRALHRHSHCSSHPTRRYSATTPGVTGRRLGGDGRTGDINNPGRIQSNAGCQVAAAAAEVADQRIGCAGGVELHYVSIVIPGSQSQVECAAIGERIYAAPPLRRDRSRRFLRPRTGCDRCPRDPTGIAIRYRRCKCPM